MRTALISMLTFCLCMAAATFASDHADPIFNKSEGAGLTGLFVFPRGDRLVAIVAVLPGLDRPPPYPVDDVTFNIHFDWDSALRFDVAADVARYGGTVAEPAAIDADAVVTFQLDKQGRLKERQITGLENEEAIRTWAGVRDDPFIFPRFFGTNVVAMVVSIPRSSFPAGQRHWLIWASAEKGGDKVDHVGRSLRTMNPRLDFLNTLHPRDHVAAVRRNHDEPGLIRGLLMKHLRPLFGLRHYDFFPDVVIYSDRTPPGFPNGRRLTDDIAALACRTGDCLLWELSFADDDSWPRRTANDKPFLPHFPYLAPPWPVRPSSAP